jgi:hypothetical protein
VVGGIYAGEPGSNSLDYMRVAYAIPLSEAGKLLHAGGARGTR